MVEKKFSRRTFLKGVSIGAGIGLGATAEIIRRPEVYTGAAGHLLDWLVPPVENYGFPVLTNLLPRMTNEPTIRSQQVLSSEKIAPANLDTNHTLPMLTVPEFFAQGRFSGTKLQPGFYTYAGCAVITTREGIIEGRQEYSALFIFNQQTLAVGYESSRVALLDSQTHEWEDVTVSNNEQNSHVITIPSVWPKLLRTRFHTTAEGMLENIEFGNQVLTHREAQPFYGVRADTLMPNSMQLQLTPENVVSSAEETLKFEKPYYITADGILIDLNHLGDKPRTVLQWLMQLHYYQRHSQKYGYKYQSYTINTNYLGGNVNQVEFNVDSSQEINEETVLQMMALFTNVSEGVLQYDIVARARSWWLPVETISKNSGYSPEDPYTNTLATHFAYQLFSAQQSQYSALFNEAIDSWVAQSPQPLEPAQLNSLSEKFIYQPTFNKLYLEIFRMLLEFSPCQVLSEPKTVNPLGIYPFNPVKINNYDQDPLITFSLPESTRGITLTKYPNWAESLPASIGRIKSRILRFLNGK